MFKILVLALICVNPIAKSAFIFLQPTANNFVVTVDECDHTGRIVDIRTNGCGVAPFDCELEIDWVPSASHEILSLRMSTIQNGDWQPIIDQPIRDSAVNAGVQYTFTFTTSLIASFKAELHNADIVEICTIQDN